jgi:hypothetical protein
MKDKIGLVGLGLVGTAIAERLLAGRFDVVGFDIDSARCQHMKKLGGKAAGSSAEVAQAAKRIVLSKAPLVSWRLKHRRNILSIRPPAIPKKPSLWRSGFQNAKFTFWTQLSPAPAGRYGTKKPFL